MRSQLRVTGKKLHAFFLAAAASIRQAEYPAAESRLVEIGRQSDTKAIKPQLAANDGCLLEIHARACLRRNQLDEWTAMFGHDHALTPRCRRGGFGEAGFDLAYRQFHDASPALLAQVGQGTDWHSLSL